MAKRHCQQNFFFFIYAGEKHLNMSFAITSLPGLLVCALSLLGRLS